MARGKSSSPMKRFAWLLIALPVVAAMAAAFYCYFYLPNLYTATATVGVAASPFDSPEAAQPADTGETDEVAEPAEPAEAPAAASVGQPVDKAMALLTSADVQGSAARAISLTFPDNYTVLVQGNAAAATVDVSVTGTSPTVAALYANQLVKAAMSAAQADASAPSLSIVREAAAPDSPSGPPRLLYTAFAFLAGLILALIIIAIAALTGTRIRSGEEASELLGVPIIGRMPAIEE